MGRSLQSKDHIHLSERVFEVVGGLSSSTEKSVLSLINYMSAKCRKHRVITTQVTSTVMEMTWHLTETEMSSMVWCLHCLHSYVWKVL